MANVLNRRGRTIFLGVLKCDLVSDLFYNETGFIGSKSDTHKNSPTTVILRNAKKRLRDFIAILAFKKIAHPDILTYAWMDTISYKNKILFR